MRNKFSCSEKTKKLFNPNYLKISLWVFTVLLSNSSIKSQNLKQTLRGTILDQDGKYPLIGVNVILDKSDPLVGTTTDIDGNFRLENVPIGRVDLLLRYVGYEDKLLPNILVSSGKEVILELEMQENVVQMQAVEIKAQKEKGEVLNEMAIISSRSFSVEETKRYAGSFSDPSRMVSAFAGVTSDAEGDNDIMVRGNSSKGILWRLEGIEIPNPNHFADEGYTGGPISALNSDLLSNSDFYTGAFSPEYGNALSGIFDMRLRTGNNEKREYSFGLGVLGTDISMEGPIKKGYLGSYLFNYRYSSLALLDDAGVVDFGGVPKYQDMCFKVVLPSKDFGVFTLFGLGGKSHIIEEEEDIDGKITGKDDFSSELGVIGLKHTIPVSDKSYIRTNLSASANGSGDTEEIPDSISGSYYLDYKGHWRKKSYRAEISMSTKFNAKNRLITGAKITKEEYDMYDRFLDEELDRYVNGFNMKKDASYYQAYTSWKHRFNDDITMVTGVHSLYYSLNDQLSIEPRFGLKWQFTPLQAINVGYGLHSKTESVVTYYTIINHEDGTSSTPNTNIKFPKSHHYVLGYEQRLDEHINTKIEFYYQDLFDVPVENVDTSQYSLLNSFGGYTDKALVNDGTGKNYGVEITLERYFANSYYFLATTSIYESKYKSKEGIERNTRFNGNYICNFLIGKEIKVGRKAKNNLLNINTKFTYTGGTRYLPVNLEKSIEEDETVYDYSKAWEDKLDHVFLMNLNISYRINKPKASHEFLIDIVNTTNNDARVWEYYDSETKNLAYDRQLGLIPNIMYRIHL